MKNLPGIIIMIIIVDLARALKMQWNMKVMVTPIVIGALETTSKVLVRELEKLKIEVRTDTILTTASLKSVQL